MSVKIDIEVYAPKGFKRIEKFLTKSILGNSLATFLKADDTVENQNERVLFESQSESQGMLTVKGKIEAEFNEAERLITELSDIFCKGGFKHRMEIQEQDSNKNAAISSP